jgi:ribonuclease HII
MSETSLTAVPGAVRGGVVVPGLARESVLSTRGYRAIAGVDEAGRGAWAGPLVAAAVILPNLTEIDEAALLAQLAGVRDSKTLDHARRERLLPAIEQVARAIGVGWVEAEELDLIGLGAANRVAWERAVAALPLPPDYLLLDAFRLRTSPLPQEPIVRGDRDCLSIAAASIVAKVTRDRALVALDARFPPYGFGRHKGYGTAAHQAALCLHGPCPEHRQSFAPLRALAETAPLAPQSRRCGSTCWGEKDDGPVAAEEE